MYIIGLSAGTVGQMPWFESRLLVVFSPPVTQISVNILKYYNSLFQAIWFITECVWSYGGQCQYPYSRHCINQTCDRFNGSCLLGFSDEFMYCEPGKYNRNEFMCTSGEFITKMQSICNVFFVQAILQVFRFMFFFLIVIWFLPFDSVIIFFFINKRFYYMDWLYNKFFFGL